MKRRTIAGLIAIAAVVAIVMSVGCIEEKSTSSFEIEYPVTACFETELGSVQITLYVDGSAFAIIPGEGNFHGEWEIKKKTNSKIEYLFGFESASHSNALHFVLFSNNDAILEPGFLADNIPGYWFYRL